MLNNLSTYLEETTYMVQLKGCEEKGKEDLYYLLNKFIYALQQFPRSQYKSFNDYIASNGFQRSSYDNFVYVNTKSYRDKFYPLLYVDDMLLAGRSKKDLNHVKDLLKKEFDMKDMRK